MAENDQDGKRALGILQSMIDIFAERLFGLRTQCSTSNELTQHEIRSLEGKLIKLFARQLVERTKMREQFGIIPANLKNIPKLEQWLQVVGLCRNCIQNITYKIKSVEALLEKPHCNLKSFLSNCIQLDEEFRRISTALKNLKRCIEILLKNVNEINNSGIDSAHLHWDSWNWQNARPYPDGSLPSSYASAPGLQEWLTINFNNTVTGNSEHGIFGDIALAGSSDTLPVLSPPLTPVPKIKKEDYVLKLPGSMSDKYRHPQNYGIGKYTNDIATILNQTVSKSRSDESQLFNISDSSDKFADNNNFNFNCENGGKIVRSCSEGLPTVPNTDHSSPSVSYSSPTRSPFMSIISSSTKNSMLTVTMDFSPMRNPDFNLTSVSSSPNGSNFPAVPRSPRILTSVSRVMAHDISHRFTKHFSFKKPCDYCCKPIIMNTGLKCKECRYRCHKDCESKVPPSCGLPVGFVEEFKKQLTPDDGNNTISSTASNGTESPLINRHIRGNVNSSPAINGFISNVERGVKGGSDTLSTNSHSSAPSSPALFITNRQIPTTASAILTKKKFDFSVNVIQEAQLASTAINDADSSSETAETIYDKVATCENSQDSQNWDNECIDKVWPRQYSVSMKEWEIPWDDLKMSDKLGIGHFGTVYSGYWHGDVAVKVINMDYMGDEKILENFKSEVGTFRKTRHDNLVLFMGACMKPPHLAIVTSMVHGITLYKYIHLRRDKFSMGKITIIAQQISQGMGYLHAKGIVHKDLRTKNIFLEKERVIITDFGLFSITKLCFKNRTQDGLIIPPGWLCYLAPEIMRNLRVHVRPDDDYLPFSKTSDVYAFGTVWYELLCGEWPYTSQDTEAIIWQVGKGMKPSLANLEASRDVKDILMQCWAYTVNRRPDFTLLLKTLDKLPKKKLARSPSHPVHLSRSAESMF